MLIRKDKLREFCRGLRNRLSSPPHAPRNDAELRRGQGYFYQWSTGCRDLAMVALDLGFSHELARGLLADSAWAYIGLQRYTSRTSAPDVPRTLFRIGTCHDVAAAAAFCHGYLDTPEGRRGEIGPWNLATPYPDDHYWHFANALALFHAGEPASVTAALDEIVSLPPRKQWKHSDNWFKAMTGLALHCLTVSTPDPWELLRNAAEINQKMFARDYKDRFFEAWFAEIALSFAAAAQQRGWEVPDRDPHPSMPLGLLRLPPMPVPDFPWDQPPVPDPELVRAIERVAKGLPPRKGATAPKRPSRPAKASTTRKGQR